jgi:hypothetical protein
MLHTLQLLYTHYGEVDAIKKHVKVNKICLLPNCLGAHSHVLDS